MLRTELRPNPTMITNFPQEELAELSQFCAEIRSLEEGGVSYLLLKGLHLPDGCTPDKTDSLFCPTPIHGYNARLLFPEKIQGPQGLNWNHEARIFEKTWYAFSWQLNQPDLRLAQKVAIILGALR